MTRADIEAMLNNLAATTRYLHDSGRLLREAAEHMTEAADKVVIVSDRLKETSEQVSAAITAGLSALHGDDQP